MFVWVFVAPSPCPCFSSRHSGGRMHVACNVPLLIPFCRHPSCLPWPGLTGPLILTRWPPWHGVAGSSWALSVPMLTARAGGRVPKPAGQGHLTPAPRPRSLLRTPPEIQPWRSPLQDGFYGVPAPRQSSVSCRGVGGKILAPQAPVHRSLVKGPSASSIIRSPARLAVEAGRRHGNFILFYSFKACSSSSLAIWGALQGDQIFRSGLGSGEPTRVQCRHQTSPAAPAMGRQGGGPGALGESPTPGLCLWGSQKGARWAGSRASRDVSTTSLAKSCPCLVPRGRASWQSFLKPAGHHRARCHLAGVQDPPERGHAEDGGAQLLFTLRVLPGNPTPSLELDQVWDAQAEAAPQPAERLRGREAVGMGPAQQRG